MKRTPTLYLSVLLLIIACLPALSGCKSNGGDSADISSLKGTSITMVSHFDPGVDADPAYNPLAQTVDWWRDTVGGNFDLQVYAADIYPTKLLAMTAAGNSPEIVMVDQRGWMPRLAVQNVLMPTDDLVETSELLDFEKQVYDDLSWNGKHYAIGVNGTWAQCLWYNKTMFENAGLTTPREYWDQGNWTWDTFLDVAKELTADTNRDGQIDQWGWASWSMEVWPSSNNTTMTKVNDNATVDVVWDDQSFVESAQFQADLINKYQVQPPDTSFHVNNYKAGKVAMSAGANDFVRTYCNGMTDEVDNAPLPLGPNQDPKNPQYIGYSLFYGIGNGCDNVKGVTTFMHKLREVTTDIKTKNQIEPGSSYSYLTAEQIKTCEYVDSLARINYESGFGDWENLRWNFWTDILFNNVPVSTALSSYKPVLENEIQTTINSTPAEVSAFEPVPMESFSTDSAEGLILTRNGLEDYNPYVTMGINKEGLVDGSGLSISYAGSDNWAILARTDTEKIKLPSYHRYIVTFDCYNKSSKGVYLYGTIRPKATMLSDETAFGFESVAVKAGAKTSVTMTIDVLSKSEDNVLVLLTEKTAADLVIDNFQISEG